MYNVYNVVIFMISNVESKSEQDLNLEKWLLKDMLGLAYVALASRQN